MHRSVGSHWLSAALGMEALLVTKKKRPTKLPFPGSDHGRTLGGKHFEGEIVQQLRFRLARPAARRPLAGP